jgi:hypothetical protein
LTKDQGGGIKIKVLGDGIKTRDLVEDHKIKVQRDGTKHNPQEVGKKIRLF